MLRGRDPELTAIGESLAAAAAGRGAVLLLDGPPGIGKSSLLAEAVTMAERARVRPLFGQAFESQQAVPFAPLLAAALNGDPPIAPPEMARTLGGPSDLRYWMLQELQGLLEATALDGPLALVLDDLQWADAGTLAALSTLPSHLSSTPIVWMLARRPMEGRAELRQTVSRLDRAGARRLRIGPLSTDAVAGVIGDLLGAPADPGLLALAAHTRGNPLLLVELVEGLQDEGRLRRVRGHVQLSGDELPRRLAESMRERLDRLSDDGRDVVRMASVLGPTFSVQQIASMLERRASTLVAAVEEAVAADLFVEAGDRLAFRHDLVRDAVLKTLARSLRRALQREAATVLLDAGAAPGEVAAKLAEGAEVGDREAIAGLRQAAGLLAGSDAASAAALSMRALELLPEHDEGRGALVAETVVLLHSALRPDDARAVGDDALARVLAPREEAEVRLSLSSMVMRAPLTRAGENRRALEIAGLTPVMRARHLGWLAFNLATVDAREAVAVAGPAMAAAEATGDLQGRVMASLALICVDSTRGRSVRALERSEELRHATRGAPPDPYLLIVDFFHACALTDLGRIDEALDIVADGVARARHERNTWLLETWAQTGSGIRLAAGRLGDARAEAESCEGVVDQVADGNFAGATALVTLAQVAVHTGDTRRLRSAETAARRLYHASSSAVRRHASWILALAAMARDDPREAARWLADDELAYAAPFLPDDAGHEPAVARIAIAAGDRELGRRALEIADTRVEQNPGVPLLGAVQRQTRALIDDDAAGLLEATESLRDTQRPLLHAAAAEDAGRALARAGRIDQAVALLTEALGRYAACEATADARRVRRVLHDNGVRGRLRSHERPARGWASLTDSERRVVRVVARGATNRDAAEQLFLSPHTVSSHLRHAFSKLEINSRNELIRLVLAEEGGADGAH
jgi:DNA-binding CsgD family transcriptional regulator